MELVQDEEQFAVEFRKFDGVVEVQRGRVMRRTWEVWTETDGVMDIVHVACCPTTCELLTTEHPPKLAAENVNCTCTNEFKSAIPLPSTKYVSTMGLLCANADDVLNLTVILFGMTFVTVSFAKMT